MLKLPPKKPPAKPLLIKALPHLLDALGYSSMKRLIIAEAEKRLTENQARIVLDILKVMLEEW
jgi:hypothetical protein